MTSAVTDWRACWYPVCLVEDLPSDRPHGFSIHGESLVLFRGREDRIACLADRCPHRAARLSDGHLTGGNLECGYHGWQFGTDGRCVHIPQLRREREIPAPACVRTHVVVERQGMVWVWPGDEKTADAAEIPVLEHLERPDCVSIDFMMDLPYDQSALIENVIDIAHIHIAHDGVRGGGRRELARPLEFDVLESSAKGIRSRFRSMGLDPDMQGLPRLRGASVEFVAPNLVKYESDYEDPSRWSGLALYSLPLDGARCRLIYRTYSNFWSWKDRLRPRSVQHWTQCKILEQDMQVVIGQVAEIDRAGSHLEDLWLPLKTSDALVVLYRKWVDEHGSSPPSYRGFATARSDAASREAQATPPVVDRFSLHTRICSSCGRAHRLTTRWSVALGTAAVALLALGALTGGSRVSIAAVVAAILAATGFVVARRAKARFE